MAARFSYREEREEVGEIHFHKEELGGRTVGVVFMSIHPLLWRQPPFSLSFAFSGPFHARGPA